MKDASTTARSTAPKKPHDPDEMLAVVDDNDNMVRQATRKEIHTQGLQHREVAVYLINNRNEVLLQEREDCGLLDHSCAGHFPAEQTYLEAAQREFAEELGIALLPEEFHALGKEKLLSSMPGMTNSRFMQVYVVKKDVAKLDIDHGEVRSVRFYALDELTSLLNIERKMTPSLRTILEKHIIPMLKAAKELSALNTSRVMRPD